MGLRILAVLLLASTAHAQQTSTYRIERSYGDVVAAVERLANEPRTTPFKVPNLPALIEGRDVIVTTHMQPSKRYYRVDLKLENPIGKLHTFDKRLEVWGKPDHYVLRSSVCIGWGRDNRCGIIARIKARILSGAECAVLDLERSKIESYARQMGTPEVELLNDSWGKILIDAYRLMRRAMELKQ